MRNPPSTSIVQQIFPPFLPTPPSPSLSPIPFSPPFPRLPTDPFLPPPPKWWFLPPPPAGGAPAASPEQVPRAPSPWPDPVISPSRRRQVWAGSPLRVGSAEHSWRPKVGRVPARPSRGGRVGAGLERPSAVLLRGTAPGEERNEVRGVVGRSERRQEGRGEAWAAPGERAGSVGGSKVAERAVQEGAPQMSSNSEAPRPPRRPPVPRGVRSSNTAASCLRFSPKGREREEKSKS